MWDNAMRIVEYDYEGEDRLLAIGPDRSGALLEIVAVPVREAVIIIHSDRLRPSRYDYLRWAEMAKTQRSAEAEMAALDAISPVTHPARDATHFRESVAARKAVLAAEDALREAIAAARRDGESWTVIGAALGTTRQNAYQRFGRDVPSGSENS